MTNHFRKVAFTDSVKEIQELMGSRKAYSRGENETQGICQISEDEAEFIAGRDSFYMASVSETNWPYVQHRGGPKGFLKVLSETEIAFADFSGNRQYISVGNFKRNSKVALILVDYPTQTRLKILGEARILDLEADSFTIDKLRNHGSQAVIERGFVIRVLGLDWNCPQHITPRWTAEDIQRATAPLVARISELEIQLKKLKSEGLSD